MPDDPLRRRSALASLYREGSHGPSPPGLSLAEQRVPGMFEARIWDDSTHIGGIALPAPNRAAATDDIVALSLGPRRFLLVGPDLPARLLGASVAVADQSHARVVVRLAGPRVRDVLAKGTGIDLARFAKGDVAATLLGQIAVVLHAIDDDAIDVYAPRSYSLSLWEWLVESAGEYGYRVEPRNDR